MEKAGWLLIWVGLGLVILRSLIDFWHLLTGKQPLVGIAGEGPGVSVSLKDLAELLKAPHGAGIALVITGAVLLLAGSGIDVSFGGSVDTPTPTPTPTTS